MKGEKGIIPARMAFNPQTIGNHMRFRGKGHVQSTDDRELKTGYRGHGSERNLYAATLVASTRSRTRS